MIVGTAGHIDHGKTSLVRALTGVDTDRLPEEKARGISIELGYAYVAGPGATRLGFIDVPGHERFVHTMLAGASGIDCALLVVAADDGVMPQTREHLAILRLLGIVRGRVALTKIDRVSAERVADVRQEVMAFLQQSALPAWPIHAVSSPASTGIGELRAALFDDAAQLRRRSAAEAFRLAVDRCFVLAGQGTVVTGTIFAGSVQTGDDLMMAPRGLPVRVRSLHAQGQSAPQAGPGMRCALQLAGVQREQVQRGDWVVAPVLAQATQRVDARFSLLADATRPLRHWSPVHLHLGATHVMARLALLEGETLLPGQSARIQLVTEGWLNCCHGDHFVVRDQSAQVTLGGGRILDPAGWPRHRRSPARLQMLAALELADPRNRVCEWLRSAAAGMPLARLQAMFNQSAAVLQEWAQPCVVLGSAAARELFARNVWDALAQRVLAQLERYHGENPAEAGLATARLKRMCAPALSPIAFIQLIEQLIGESRLERSGAWLHLPGHRVQLGAREAALAPLLQPLIEAGRFDPPWVRDLAASAGASERDVRSTLQALARQGVLYQVVRDLFYSARQIRQLAGLARALERERGAIRAADFRDGAGLGRKRAIQILEFFDRVGLTRRVQDDHRLRGDSLFEPAGLDAAAPTAMAVIE